MGSTLFQLGLVVVLVAVNAAFAGTEMALVSLRESQLARLAEQSRTGALLARLAAQPTQFLATIQIGITLAGFLASAAAAVSLARPLQGRLDFLGGAAEAVSIIVVTLILTYVTLVFGELAPKRIAMQRAERWGLVMARPLTALSAGTRPAVALLSRSTDLAVRLAGLDPELQRPEVTEEELRDMVAVQESFTPEQRKILDGAFEISERTLGEIVVPRREVFALDADARCADALAELAASGHSRAPVAPGRDLDHVIGFVHLRQLLVDGEATVARLAAAVPFFPETARVLDTLRSLQQQRAQLAMVMDEYGATEGIVTVEDLVEELVGEIYDEADPDVLAVRRLDDGTLVLAGRFPIHDLVDLGVEVEAESGSYATIAGLLLDRLGHIPTQPGEHVELGDWTATVNQIHGHAITEVLLRRRPVNP